MKKKELKNNTVIYRAKSGALELRKDAQKQTIWATQAEMGRIFNVNSQAITKHLKNIYAEGELKKQATCSNMEQVQNEGGRTIRRIVEVYDLDAIIAVGYRINSVVGTKFRQWATKTLRQYIVEGYAINKQRIAKNYEQFLEAVESVKRILPRGATIDTESVLELVNLFADTECTCRYRSGGLRRECPLSFPRRYLSVHGSVAPSGGMDWSWSTHD
jgi:hypothetical protein